MRYLKYAVMLGFLVVVAGAGTAHAQVRFGVGVGVGQSTVGQLMSGRHRTASMATMGIPHTRARHTATTALTISMAACL